MTKITADEYQRFGGITFLPFPGMMSWARVEQVPAIATRQEPSRGKSFYIDRMFIFSLRIFRASYHSSDPDQYPDLLDLPSSRCFHDILFSRALCQLRILRYKQPSPTSTSSTLCDPSRLHSMHHPHHHHQVQSSSSSLSSFKFETHICM